MIDRQFDDLEETGLAYLQLRNAAIKVNDKLISIYNDPDVSFMIRSDILNVMLIVREALEL